MNNKNLPQFKYSPNAYDSDSVFYKAEPEKAETCQCCNEKTVYFRGMYAFEDVGVICPKCFSDGTAAEKFDADSIQDAEEIENSAEKTEELFRRTPGFDSWQGEWWLVHCNDYCAFLGDTDNADLEKRGIADEVYAEYEQQGRYDIELVRKYLGKNMLSGYLFKCLHCGKHRLHVDAG